MHCMHKTTKCLRFIEDQQNMPSFYSLSVTIDTITQLHYSPSDSFPPSQANIGYHASYPPGVWLDWIHSLILSAMLSKSPAWKWLWHW